MSAEISIVMRGVSGTLRYINGKECYEISVENTGDYSRELNGTHTFDRGAGVNRAQPESA